jgi:hypothetical protein
MKLLKTKKWTKDKLTVHKKDVILGSVKDEIMYRKIFEIETIETLDREMWKNKGYVSDHGLFEILKPLHKRKISCKLKCTENIQKLNEFIISVCKFFDIICEISYDIFISKNDDIIQIIFHDSICTSSFDECTMWDDYLESEDCHPLFHTKVIEKYEISKIWELAGQNGSRIIRGRQFTDSLCGIYD